ncbi:MAG: helix-turn-helix transcriptional regulator [Muribaculaceae bacterium]|nr:helix-turn-helix transcriptional regulator [Muribaculaceae bacterium]
MEKLNQIIERESGNIDFSIEMFASQMGMSRSNLYKKVSQLTEMSPLEYLRDKRIEKGKKMLDDGHTFISQVAYSVGLSPKQFSKFFKEKFGCLPSEYIKPDK